MAVCVWTTSETDKFVRNARVHLFKHVRPPRCDFQYIGMYNITYYRYRHALGGGPQFAKIQHYNIIK